MPIRTPRLELHLLSLPVIEALLDGDHQRADALVSFPVSADTFSGDDDVLTLRRDQLRADPTELAWLYRAVVLLETGEVVARAGFHARPDVDGTVEIGYRVQQAHRCQGYATELTAAMLAWASRRGAARCLASTSPSNLASQAVLARLGFVRTGEQMDDIDGLEWIFTRVLGDPLPGVPAHR